MLLLTSIIRLVIRLLSVMLDALLRKASVARTCAVKERSYSDSTAAFFKAAITSTTQLLQSLSCKVFTSVLPGTSTLSHAAINLALLFESSFPAEPYG
jgi:hypothetical protein